MKVDLATQEERYKSRIAKQQVMAEKVEAAERAVQDLKSEVDQNASDLLDKMREPHALSSSYAYAILELKSGLDRVKLPEGVAREFFEELADEIECVCGRSIDEYISAVIRERAERYLASDDVTLLNAIKLAISEAVGETPGEASNQLSVAIGSLSGLVHTLYSAENDLDDLKIQAEQVDPDLTDVKKEIGRLKQTRRDMISELQKFEGTDDKVDLSRLDKVDVGRIHAIATIEDGIKVLEDRVDEIRNTRKLRKKRDILTTIMKNAFDKARNAITVEIRDEANSRIRELMPNNHISIERINRCLELKGQSAGSVGETLSIAYAFLSTLFERSNEHRLPFIVDSPANSIDLEIRPNIGQLVPKLTGQFIAFMISSERERFVSSLKESSNDDIKFITLFRKGALHLDSKAGKHPSCTSTEDGFRVIDEQFFNEFQLDEEEN